MQSLSLASPMWTKLWNEIALAGGVATSPPAAAPITEAELAELPRAACAYLDFYRVAASQPKHWSLRMEWRGRFRLGRNRPWMPIRAVQYDARFPVARIFHMKARVLGIVPLLARDTYVDGQGHMVGKLAEFATVVDGKGPAFDEGELVTWVNDCVLFAPSMLLGPDTRWSPVDASTFDLSFTDHGRTVTARVHVDERGAPVDFETTNRFVSDPDDRAHPLVRARWSTPVDAWERIGEQTYPRRARAVWHLARGEFTYAEFELVPGTLFFDAPPGAAQARRASRTS